MCLSKNLVMEDVAVMALWCYSLSSLEQAVLLLLERVLSDPKAMQNLETVVNDSLLVSKHDPHHWKQCLEEQLLVHRIEFEKALLSSHALNLYNIIYSWKVQVSYFKHCPTKLTWMILDYGKWTSCLCQHIVFDMVIFYSNSHVIIFTQTTNEFRVEILKVSS